MSLYYTASELCDPDLLDSIWFKRTRTINESYEEFVEKGDIRKSEIFLSKEQVGRAVDFYISEYQIYKLKYRVKGTFQLHRVAGLLAAALVRHRPIQLKSPDFKSESDSEARLNELFALHVSLSICAEYYVSQEHNVADILTANVNLFNKWKRRMLFLLDSGDFTSESLVLVFETFCMNYFPDNFLFEEDHTES